MSQPQEDIMLPKALIVPLRDSWNSSQRRGKALSVDPNNTRALFRRGCAYSNVVLAWLKEGIRMLAACAPTPGARPKAGFWLEKTSSRPWRVQSPPRERRGPQGE